MKDKYYYVLSDCLSRRQEWISEIEIYFRFRELREKAEKETFSKNLTIYLLYKLINLPSNILNFLSKIQQYSQYNKTLKEIEVIRQEIDKYYNPQINNRRKNNVENQKNR
tara:strand:+ start:894 stop:1223 length:330 start_codon:yes stop_codon:yes gene_type:complete